MNDVPLQQQFMLALDAVVAEIKADRSVLAAILCGSLSHDTVWAKSDIDLVLVTIDDRLVSASGVALYTDRATIHAILIPRAEFRRVAEGSVRNSFAHAFLTKGRLLYTHDPTIAGLCASLSEMGDRDRQIQLLRAATAALPAVYKARKWFVTRGDLEYTALWILYAATALARIEVIGARLVADREVIPQALRLNPAFFTAIYTDMLNEQKTPETVNGALAAIDRYLDDRQALLFGPIVDYLREVREARSSREVEDHFARTFDVADVTTACEYLADRGRIGRASAPVRLTRKSRVTVQELAFYYLDGPDA